MNIKFSPFKLFIWISIYLMSFMIFFDSCVEQSKSIYKAKRIQPRSYYHGSIDFINIDSRYEAGDTVVWNDYLYVILKKLDP